MIQSNTMIPAAVRAECRPSKRSGVAFGPRFFHLLLLGLAWLGLAFLRPRFGFAALAWDVLVLCLWGLDLARMPSPSRLTVRRVWRAPLALGVPSEIEIMVENTSDTGIHVHCTDEVARQLRVDFPAVELTVGARRDARLTYDVRPGERGNAAMGNAYIRYQSPLRLAERWAVAPLGQQVRVYPNLEEAKRHSIYLLRSRQIDMQKRYARVRGSGREFDCLREYRLGDEVRDICWSASARRGKPVTKLYQMERSQIVWLVIDSGRLMRARIGDLSKLDYAVNAALSLAQVALYSGDRVGLITYGRGVRHRLAPTRGSAHLRALIESLADIRQESAEADHLQAAGMLFSIQHRRSLMVWLTDLAETAMTPEVIEAASHMMPRHVVVFAVIGQPDLLQAAFHQPDTIPEMYQTAAAQEVILRRELLLARLRERGALALEVESGALSTALVNSYLSVKQRSQL